MEQTKKWWQSRTIQAAIALIIGSVSFVAITTGFVDPSQLDQASTVYPEVKNGIELIKGGQLFAGFSAIVGSLVLYFRVKTSAKITA